MEQLIEMRGKAKKIFPLIAKMSEQQRDMTLGELNKKGARLNLDLRPKN